MSRTWSRVDRKVLVINKMPSAMVHSYYFTDAAVVMLYIDSLPSLTAQARSSSNPWPLFREDKRFSKLHKFLGKILCVPATSDAVEGVFSHGGEGFSCVHIGPVWDIRSSQTWSLPSATNIWSRLVFKETITAGECWTVTVCMQLKVDID